MEYSKIDLGILRYWVCNQIDLKECINTQATIELLHHHVPHMLVKIEKKCLGERLDKVTKIKYPSSWWQGFKLRFMPYFILKKYPVLYTVHEISFNIVYPDLVFKLDDDKAMCIIDHDKYYRKDNDETNKNI